MGIALPGRRFWSRSRIAAAAIVLAVVAATAWWRFDSTVMRDRHLQKSTSITQCTNVIRDTIGQSLRTGGSSESDSRTISSSAQFSAVDGTAEYLSFDNYRVPAELGKDRSAVLTNWQIGGHVSLTGPLPFGSGLGSDNRFSCSVIVFDDNTIHVAGRQVSRG